MTGPLFKELREKLNLNDQICTLNKEVLYLLASLLLVSGDDKEKTFNGGLVIECIFNKNKCLTPEEEEKVRLKLDKVDEILLSSPSLNILKEKIETPIYDIFEYRLKTRVHFTKDKIEEEELEELMEKYFTLKGYKNLTVIIKKAQN